jgi:hypothetical protein
MGCIMVQDETAGDNNVLVDDDIFIIYSIIHKDGIPGMCGFDGGLDRRIVLGNLKSF